MNSTLLFPVSDLTWDQFIYPRGSKSEKTINAYAEALEIGAQFPPIKIQRVFNYADGNETTEATIIIDGIHRWFAFKEKGIKEIAAVEWKDKPLDYEKNKTALLLESAECNIRHGDRLSPGDKKWKWPITKKPDLIFFDPPYYIKKEKAYREKANEKTPSISSYTKEEYERFLKGFFLLAHRKSNQTTSMAFLNADWRDFESAPALKEKPDKSITIFDYHRLLSKTGWKVTHRIECPLSSERLSGNQVQRMQDKRILGTVGRTLLIAKRS